MIRDYEIPKCSSTILVAIIGLYINSILYTDSLFALVGVPVRSLADSFGPNVYFEHYVSV